jgi:hypothetical protein
MKEDKRLASVLGNSGRFILGADATFTAAGDTQH